jgi:hypothetical protein
MCLTAGHERFAFICDGCGKHPAIVFLQRRQWQIWQLGCEVNLTEKMRALCVWQPRLSN